MSTNIEWTTETWNPLSGCSKVSDGCKNCYAIKDAHRLAGNPNPKIAAKYAGTTKIENGKMNWTGQINLASEETLTQPIRWTRPRKIFVNSMSDLFHENVPDEWIDKIFAVMAQARQHTFQILTKRPERMRDYLVKQVMTFGRDVFTQINRGVENPAAFINFPLSNVWCGTSVENQKAADERIPYLLDTPAAVRFLSVEPMLGEIDLTNLRFVYPVIFNAISGEHFNMSEPITENGNPVVGGKIDWIICGGESGSGARPVHPDWVKSLRDQCVAADVKFFFKQWGNWFPVGEKPADDGDWAIGKDKAISHTHLWKDERKNVSFNIGKHNAGRYLDGETWDEYPK